MLLNLLSTAFNAPTHNIEMALTVNEALSGILGSVSLTCWVFLLVPQVIENYRNQSAEALSLAFVIVWFLGDLSNLLGAAWAGLVPTIIAIAVYFCFSDAVLVGQILYYGIKTRRREGRGFLGSMKDTVVEADSGAERRPSQATDVRRSTDNPDELQREPSAQENEPLLSRKRSRGNSYGAYSLPGSGDARMVRDQIARQRSSSGAAEMSREEIRARRISTSNAAASAQQEPLAKIFEESGSTSSASRTSRAIKNTFSIIGIVTIGTVGWLIAYETGTWKPVPPPVPPIPPTSLTTLTESNPAGAQFLGYISAVLYLTARLPQIWKNYREQSCEGLSLLFFILSLMGNGTYGAGILFHSLESNYVRKNVPWLIGSLGTMVEDVVVFWQFRLYRDNIEQTKIVEVEEVAVVEDGAPGRAER